MTTDIIIKSEDKGEKKEPSETDIKDTLKEADEYEKKKEEIEKLEALYEREKVIRAKMALGGRAEAGAEVKQKTEEEKIQEEASKYINAFD